MANFPKPRWYMRLRYRARRALWEIRGDYEEPEYYLLPFLVDPGRAAIDVGANYGGYAGRLATLTRRVHCFEPNPDNVAGLRARMSDSVVVHQAAASSRNGKAEIVIPRGLGAAQAGAQATIEPENPVATTPGSERIVVNVVRLDDEVREPVGFVKIDVEGHELAVLEGAERILREDRPALLVESSPVSNPAAPGNVFDFLVERGYVGLFLFRGRLTPLSAFRADIHQALGADGRMARDHVFNFVFVPGPAG